MNDTSTSLFATSLEYIGMMGVGLGQLSFKTGRFFHVNYYDSATYDLYHIGNPQGIHMLGIATRDSRDWDSCSIGPETIVF